MDVVGFDELYI